MSEVEGLSNHRSSSGGIYLSLQSICSCEKPNLSYLILPKSGWRPHRTTHIPEHSPYFKAILRFRHTPSLRPQPGPEFKRILFDTDTVHRHGSAASSIGRVMSLGHTVQMARTVAIHTGSSQISSGRSHSCLVSSSISSSGTGHPGHWSRKPVVVHLLLVAHSTHFPA